MIFGRIAVSRHCTIDVADRQKNKGILGFAESGCRFYQRVENLLQIKRRAANDLEHVGGCGLLPQGLREVASENAYLLLQVGNGSGRDRYSPSFGLIYTPILDRSFASTAALHFSSPQVGHDEA